MKDQRWMKEPWFVKGSLTPEESGVTGGVDAQVVNWDGLTIFGEGGEGGEEEMERAVVCVTACKGMTRPVAQIEMLKDLEGTVRTHLEPIQDLTGGLPPTLDPDDKLGELYAKLVKAIESVPLR